MTQQMYDNRDGSESITSMWIEDKRLLCRKLDARQHWKDLASQEALHLTQDDVLLLGQSAPRDSPTEGLLNIMSERRATMCELYLYLKHANLLAAMSIIKKYVPTQYHGLMEPESIHEYDGNPPNLTPAAPPPLSATANNAPPMRLMAPQDMLQAGFPSGVGGMSLEDSFMSLPGDLDSTQIRAAHTIMSTRNFPIEDIRRATDNFSTEYLIFQGAYSSVYSVTLENTAFAAKVYNMDYGSVISDLQETRHHNHENIVSITGKCLGAENVILLYEFMTNGSLRDQLDKKGTLSVDNRAIILRGAARGIQYLHSNKPSLLHRNIKSTNILLDDGLKAKLSAFGMAIHVNKNSADPSGNHRLTQVYTHFSTRQDTSVIQRSRGYCAREVLNGKFSEKTDTYAFGVVIFEVCTGLTAYDSSRSIANSELVNYIEGSVNNIEDMWKMADKSTRWRKNIYEKLFRLAQRCTSDRPKCRPTMNQVFQDLDEICGMLYDDSSDDDVGPGMSMVPNLESVSNPFGHVTTEQAGGYYHHPMSLPAVGGYYANLAGGQSLQDHHNQQLQYPNPHRVPVESQSLPPFQVDTQISTTTSSLGLSSLGEQIPSMSDQGEGESEDNTPPSNLSRAAVGSSEQSYQEHPSLVTTDDDGDASSATDSVDESITLADDSTDDTRVDLQQYLQRVAVHRTQQDVESEESEGAELDPDLLAELDNLDLISSG